MISVRDLIEAITATSRSRSTNRVSRFESDSLNECPLGARLPIGGGRALFFISKKDGAYAKHPSSLAPGADAFA